MTKTLGNPYSQLRERNKREARPDWRAAITRAPYVVSGDGGDNRRRDRDRDRDGLRRNKTNRQRNVSPPQV